MGRAAAAAAAGIKFWNFTIFLIWLQKTKLQRLGLVSLFIY